MVPTDPQINRQILLKIYLTSTFNIMGDLITHTRCITCTPLRTTSLGNEKPRPSRVGRSPRAVVSSNAMACLLSAKRCIHRSPAYRGDDSESMREAMAEALRRCHSLTLSEFSLTSHHICEFEVRCGSAF